MNNANLIQVLVWLTIPITIGGVVKIDVSPVKEKKDSIDTNVTTIMSTSTVAAIEATTTTTISSMPTDNTTILPTQMTIANGSGIMQNVTVSVQGTVSTIFWNATSLAHLPEFTIRMMRRKFTSYDYYCPCDLKVCISITCHLSRQTYFECCTFQINFCDINCCCDIDCSSKEIMETLKCEDHMWSVHDYIEITTMQPCSVESSLSLFCIVDGHKKRKMFKQRTLAVNILKILHFGSLCIC